MSDPQKTVEEALEENATGPAKASGDSGSVEQHPLSEQLEVAKALGAKEALKKPKFGLRMGRLSPPGAV